MGKKKKIFGTAEKPRLVVYRSLRYTQAQLIDDSNQKVIAGVKNTSKVVASEISGAKNKSDAARIIGKKIAELAKDNKIEKVVFDRNGYVYHGRVKALADGAREGGLDF